MKYSLITTDDGMNPGDSLLTENAKAVLNNVFNGECICEVPLWENAENCIDRINSADICFISTLSYTDYDVDLYYNLITKIKIPIIAMASSLAVQRGEDPRDYKLNEKQREIIGIVNRYSGGVPVRDIFTKYILENNGIENVYLVGDLGLFNFGNPVQKMKQPSEIKKILITAGHQAVYNKQLMSIICYLSKKFPQAEFTYSTHTASDKALNFGKTKLKKLNIATVDTAGSCEKLDFYDTFDLHVGYRLHGHIKSLSVGTPSILISEDSRGLGQKYSLNNIGIFTGFEFRKKFKYKNIFEKIFSIKYSYSANKVIVTVLGMKKTIHIGRGSTKRPKKLIEEIDKEINEHLRTNWIYYQIIPVTIKNFYENLFIPFLRNSIDIAIKKSRKKEINV